MEFTQEATMTLVRSRSKVIVADALARGLPRPAQGLASSIELARREIESLLRGGSLDVLLLGRRSLQWKELVLRASSYLPAPCSGCGAPVWPECRPRGSPSFRCASCWEKFVWGARLVARAETEVEVWAGLRFAFPSLDL
jgi:hypothetical protein